MPTRRPASDSATARLTVRDDFPTPPLPETTATTRVAGSSWIAPSSADTPPRSLCVSAARSSGDITSNASRTDATPGRPPTSRCTCSSKEFRSGQPTTVSAIVTATSPPSISIERTMSSSVTGLRSSGSITRERAVRISSRVGMATGYSSPCRHRQLLGTRRRCGGRLGHGSVDLLGDPESAATSTRRSDLLHPAALFKLPDQVECTLVRHPEGRLDESRREERVREGEIDYLDRAAAGAGELGTVRLSQVIQPLGAKDSVLRLYGDGSQEELQPLLDLGLLPDCLQSLVILTAVLLQVPADVQQRRR